MKDILVPIDSTVGQVRFFSGIQKKISILLEEPAGRTTTSAAAHAEIIETRHMLIATVPSPQLGMWRLRIDGRGRYVVTARARHRVEDADSMIEIVSFRFLRRGGRPGHEGWFPVEQVPAAGSDAMCSVTLSGSFATTTFSFVRGTGEEIGSFRLQRAAGEADEFLGPCRVPTEPFRLLVQGVDENGNPYQRAYSALCSPSRPGSGNTDWINPP